MALDPWSCTSCLGGPHATSSNACLSSNQPVAFPICLQMYCSTDISVAHMCLVLHVMSLPLCNPDCVQIPSMVAPVGLYYDSLHPQHPSSHWITAVDPAEKPEGFLKYHCPYYTYFVGPLRSQSAHHHYL